VVVQAHRILEILCCRGSLTCRGRVRRYGKCQALRSDFRCCGLVAGPRSGSRRRPGGQWMALDEMMNVGYSRRARRFPTLSLRELVEPIRTFRPQDSMLRECCRNLGLNLFRILRNMKKFIPRKSSAPSASLHMLIVFPFLMENRHLRC